ncbi:MAG: hypothetical protein MI743_09615, partial [Sneathiellales bacterium]|nr:hypothetical protein [Sneathiellales bacterium]
MFKYLFAAYLALIFVGGTNANAFAMSLSIIGGETRTISGVDGQIPGINNRDEVKSFHFENGNAQNGLMLNGGQADLTFTLLLFEQDVNNKTSFHFEDDQTEFSFFSTNAQHFPRTRTALGVQAGILPVFFSSSCLPVEDCSTNIARNNSLV